MLKMFIKYVLLVLTIALCLNAKAQIDSLNRKINWGPKQLLYEPGPDEEKIDDRFLLYFDKAVYLHELNDLPVYNELIRVIGDNYEAIVENTLFSEMTVDELNQVADINSIQENLKISSKIVYIRKMPFVQLSFVPLRKSRLSNKVEKLISFSIRLIENGQIKQKKQQYKKYASNSVLSSGKWVKIKIYKSGIYKLSFDELINLGIENPANARIFGNGGKMLPIYNNEPSPDDLIENKILIKNDNIYFYGEGPVEWIYNSGTNFFRQQKHLYSNYSWYFISSAYNSGTNNIIETEDQSIVPATHNINTFTDYAFHETDSSNLISSGKLWVGEKFDFSTEYDYSFNFPNILANSTITIESSLLARSPINSSFTIELNNQSFNTNFAPVSYNYTSTYATHKVDKFSGNSGTTANVNIKIIYNKTTASSEGWLDYFTLNVKRQLVFGNNQMHFRNTESVGPANVGQFTLSQTNNQTQIWDITDKQSPRIINTNLNGTDLSFRIGTDSLREFIAFNESMAFTPVLTGDGVGIVENQNLHGISQADLVIICPQEFYEYALALKQIHEEKDNYTVSVVTNQQVYNEFSSGAPDVGALRNFMRMLYNRAGSNDEMPKYLCLFGDGSYDNKSSKIENTNYILTYQSENSLEPTLSFVTDDFYGFLDEDEGGHQGFLDIGIGRLPVKSSTEASNAIDKIRNYMNTSSHGDWKNNLCFIADDEDNNTHIADADELSQVVKNNYPIFNIEKIYLDAFVQQSSSSGQRYPDVNRTIDNQISKGLLIVNYTGHGNEKTLTEESILSTDQVNKYNNTYKLPVFMTATCEFSRFDDYLITSIGEQTFLNPKGAAIALFTTTRLVYSSPNFALNRSFYSYIFENDPATGFRYTLGEVMRHTKNASANGINDRNFTLLGDPALKLSYAYLNIKTNSINLLPVNGQADTIKALQKITVMGEIQDATGLKISNYNGLIYPTVFDKKQNIKTLNNDGDGSFMYSVINSQIFKGKASVKNGDFQFSFIVPKDIRYNVDTGKISYYATNYQLIEDSKGSFTNFLIGGIASTINSDSQGPDIEIYMNDESFVSGGITDKTPTLLVYLSDSSGINITGNGIGHDIIATIDKKTDQKFTVNDYYESEVDDYTRGSIRYKLPELTPGEHTLHLKAWDVYNNSSEDSINFMVALSDKLEISHVLNYPNPFSTNTSFFFEHNRPNELLEVIIHIYTVSGKIVKTIQTDMLTNGFRSTGISWDGRDDYGNKMGRGVYFYKISVRTLTGEKTSKIEKLLLLN